MGEEVEERESIEWFGQLAYMSFLLGPDAPKRGTHWTKLTEHQREWFRASAQHSIAEGGADLSRDSGERRKEALDRLAASGQELLGDDY